MLLLGGVFVFFLDLVGLLCKFSIPYLPLRLFFSLSRWGVEVSQLLLQNYFSLQLSVFASYILNFYYLVNKYLVRLGHFDELSPLLL